MKLESLYKKYDVLQKKYGAKELHSIYNGGCEENPNICFVFMNPTGKNIASNKEWKGIHSPWIGTKNIWGLFKSIGLLDQDIYHRIQEKRPNDWDEDFALEVYENVKENKYFITNLGKCTQVDARYLPDSVYLEYLDLLKHEIDIIKPKVIVTFGNQVSSILLDEKISVSQCRKRSYEIGINKNKYKVYPVYYPIGNGRFNIDKAIEDLIYIIKENN